MDNKQAKRIIIDAKWKAAFVAVESPLLGAAMAREIEALESELAVEMTAQLCDDCGSWLDFTTDPDDGAVECSCPGCDGFWVDRETGIDPARADRMDDPKLAELMDIIGKTPAPPHPISEAYL